MFDFDDTTTAEQEYQSDLELRDRVYTFELKIDDRAADPELIARQAAVYAQITAALR